MEHPPILGPDERRGTGNVAGPMDAVAADIVLAAFGFAWILGGTWFIAAYREWWAVLVVMVSGALFSAIAFAVEMNVGRIGRDGVHHRPVLPRAPRRVFGWRALPTSRRRAGPRRSTERQAPFEPRMPPEVE